MYSEFKVTVVEKQCKHSLKETGLSLLLKDAVATALVHNDKFDGRKKITKMDGEK
jgi:hypothetical protein